MSDGAASFKYAAFVSYRRAEPDRSIARRLQRLIEDYKAPAGVPRLHEGPRRVFLDDHEMSAASSLGDELRSALEASEFLVVVCSPQAAESRYVSAEIEYFQGLGRGERVLPVLVEGSPETAFPPPLRSRQPGSGLDRSGPLAADVRARSTRESRRLLNREKLRVLAPMLGVSFSELDRRESRRRKSRMVRASAATVLGAAAIAWLLTSLVQQMGRAREGSGLAESRRLAAAAGDVLPDDPDLALLLGVESLREAPTFEARNVLFAALHQREGLMASLKFHRAPVTSMAFYGDGASLVTAGEEGNVVVWDVGSRSLRRHLAYTGQRATVALSPDDRLVALGLTDGSIQLWDLSTGNIRSESRGAEGGPILDLEFVEGGARLLATGPSRTQWRLSVPELEPTPGAGVGRGAGASTWRASVSGGERGIVIWDEEGGTRVPAIDLESVPPGWPVRLPTLSADGTLLAAGVGASTIAVWRVVPADTAHQPLLTVSSDATALSFSPDGRLLAAGHRDGSISLLSWRTRSPITRVLELPDAVRAVDLEPDAGTVLISYGEQLERWSIESLTSLGGVSAGEARWVSALAGSPDDSLVAAGFSDGEVRLLRRSNLQPHDSRARHHDGRILDIAFTADGSDIVARADWNVRTWPVDQAEEGDSWIPDPWPYLWPSLGRLAPDGSALLWGLEPAGIIQSDFAVARMGLEGEARADTLVRLGPVSANNFTPWLGFGSGTESLFVGYSDRLLWLDSKSGRQTRPPLATPAPVRAAGVSPDGATLVAGEADGSIRFYDLDVSAPLGSSVRAHGRTPRLTGFAGGAAVTVAEDRVVVWSMDPDVWIQRACGLVHRNFSELEFERFFGEEPYRETCGAWGPWVAPASEGRAGVSIDTRPRPPAPGPPPGVAGADSVKTMIIIP